MACPSFASGSSITLYYAIDPDPAAAIPGTFSWERIRMTSENLDLKLTGAVSAEITATRADADSILVSGEVGGSFNFEASHTFMSNWLIAALQANKDFTFNGVAAPGNPWATTEHIQNGSTRKCIVIQKRVLRADGTYDVFLFRGCQVGDLSLKAGKASNLTGSVTVLGTGGELAVEGSTLPVGWTYREPVLDPIISSVQGLDSLQLQDSGGIDTQVTFASFDLMISNKARNQGAVGAGIYPVGIGFGSIEVKANATVYYADPTVFSAFLANDDLRIVFNLLDSDANTFAFRLNKVKVLSGSTPLASGKDDDATITSSFQAFDDPTYGAIRITRTFS